MASSAQEVDQQVRVHVYDVTLSRGYPPGLQETAESLNVPVQEVEQAHRRLADGHVLVLQPESGEILMANPFSAVPTPFLVELETYSCFGNCVWDALGIPAMLKRDAHIRTACADCGANISLSIIGGKLQPAEGVVHFAIPAQRWWEDIVFN